MQETMLFQKQLARKLSTELLKIATNLILFFLSLDLFEAA